MATRWQLRTWTKGTGAAVEPEGADDRLPVRVRPGGLTTLPPRRPWATDARNSGGSLPEHHVAGRSRRRHALGYLDRETLARLEALEAELDER
jgi:hypothetical protein